jgi:hypothetical protein
MVSPVAWLSTTSVARWQSGQNTRSSVAKLFMVAAAACASSSRFERPLDLLVAAKIDSAEALGDSQIKVRSLDLLVVAKIDSAEA